MSKNTAIEYLVEYGLSHAELKKLSNDRAAALAVLSYAASEVNALSRLYIFASHELTNKEPIDYAILIQRFVLMRIWSAKLIEFIEFLETGISGKGNVDRELRNFAQKTLNGFEKLRKSEGFILARSMRHEATNHYSFSAAKKNLKHVSEDANCSMYLHEMNGNSYYPFGEEVMFVGRMNRHGASLSSKEERSLLLDSWMEWNLEATKWLGKVHHDYVVEFVLNEFPDKFSRERDYWIPTELAKVQEGNLVPVFLRASKTQEKQ